MKHLPSKEHQNTTVNAEETYTFTPTATDTNGDTLSFSITNKPSWAIFSTVTGTPQESDVGTTNNIVITVSHSNTTNSIKQWWWGVCIGFGLLFVLLLMLGFRCGGVNKYTY